MGKFSVISLAMLCLLGNHCNGDTELIYRATHGVELYGVDGFPTLSPQEEGQIDFIVEITGATFFRHLEYPWPPIARALDYTYVFVWLENPSPHCSGRGCSDHHETYISWPEEWWECAHKTALAHELLHQILWDVAGDPDGGHTDARVWNQPWRPDGTIEEEILNLTELYACDRI